MTTSRPPREVILGKRRFHSIRIRDKAMYSNYVKKTLYDPYLYSSNFDLLWATSGEEKGYVLWKVVDGLLAVFRYYPNRVLQLAFPPLGNANPKQLVKVMYDYLRFCYDWNGRNPRVSVVRAATGSQLQFLEQSDLFNKVFQATPLPGRDRHVHVQSLLTLEGSKFGNVRQSINRFKRGYPTVVTRKADEKDIDTLLALKDEWNTTAGQKYKVIHDDRTYRRIIKHCRELNHTLLMAEAEGQCLGMIAGEILPHGQAWGSLHKRKAGIYGLSEYLYVEFAREIQRLDPNVELINMGYDIGGMKPFKDKFHPTRNEDRFSLLFK